MFFAQNKLRCHPHFPAALWARHGSPTLIISHLEERDFPINGDLYKQNASQNTSSTPENMKMSEKGVLAMRRVGCLVPKKKGRGN